MLVYRVFPYVASAGSGEPGHPMYEHHPQRAGRIDHPDYYVWYLARTPEAAAGEVFGNVAQWDASMFDTPYVPGGRRALGVFHLADDLRLCDLDDPRNLVDLGLRPTQVVVRNLALTQAWGHRIWAEEDLHDTRRRRWQAVQWWSYHQPMWSVIASWQRPTFVRVEPLGLTHHAVVEAARTLHRVLP